MFVYVVRGFVHQVTLFIFTPQQFLSEKSNSTNKEPPKTMRKLHRVPVDKRKYLDPVSAVSKITVGVALLTPNFSF